MLPFLAAALVAAATPAANPSPARPLSSDAQLLPRNDASVIARLRDVRCRFATRMVASAGEAALLRPQDRAATGLRKLKDLPPAQPCLVESAQ